MVFKSLTSPFVCRSAYRDRRRSGRLALQRTPKSPGGPIRSAHNSNIKVCVRVRPPNSLELNNSNGLRNVVEVVDDRVLIFDPVQVKTPSYFKGQLMRDPTERRNKDLKFAFDQVFSPSTSNEEVFEKTTKKILATFMEGINCCVFAYGATGAGKTHTMLGSPENPGIMSLTMTELYNRIDQCKDDIKCDVQISYIEIYNETVRDLLNVDNNGGVLNIREDNNAGITISGLSYHAPSDALELFRMLEIGNKNRTQHPTDANAESSRSHAVFRVDLKQQSITADISTEICQSKLSLIDLAGSERATVTKNRGDRLREGANINRSLLSLGNCINALAEGKRGAHIPYRDSKLTRILKDSLGGSCKTVMIAAVSPSFLSYDDTYNTLRYADRAKHIKAELKKNVFHVDAHLHQYTTIIEKQKDEIRELKEKLRQMSDERESNLRSSPEKTPETVIRPVVQQPLSFGSELLERLHCELPSLLSKCKASVKDWSDLKSKETLESFKVENRLLLQRNVETLHWNSDKIEKATDKTNRLVKLGKMREIQYRSEASEVDKKLAGEKEELESKLRSIVDEHSSESDEVITWLSDLILSQLELVSKQSEVIQINSIMACQSEQLQRQQKLIASLLKCLREEHLVLKGWDKVTSSLQSQFDSICRLLESGGRELGWADQQIDEDNINQTLVTSVTRFDPGDTEIEAKQSDGESESEFPTNKLAKARSSVGLNRKAVSTSDIGDLIRPIPPQITSDESSDQFRSFALVPQKISFQPILIETSTRPTVSVSPPSNDLNRTFTKSPEASGRLSDASDMGKLIMGDPQDKRSNSETKLASSVPSQMGFRRPLNEIRSNKLPTGGKCPPSFVATTSKPLVKVLSTSKLPGKFQPVITGVGRENRPLATSTSTYGLNGRKVV